MTVLRNIGWLTFVLSLGLSLHFLQRSSHDDPARQLAASSVQGVEKLEQSTQSLNEDQLANLRSLSDMIKNKNN